MDSSVNLQCRCGKVKLAVSGKPIITAECYCTSCRTAGEKLQLLEGAGSVLSEHGGTHFVMYRKDRIRFLAGTENLKSYRLTASSSSRRVVASCCQTPVFLEFKGGHWLSLYSGLWPQERLPAIEIRTMTSDLPKNWVLPVDALNSKRHTLSFFRKLLTAWIAMGFRSPKIDFAKEEHTF